MLHICRLLNVPCIDEEADFFMAFWMFLQSHLVRSQRGRSPCFQVCDDESPSCFGQIAGIGWGYSNFCSDSGALSCKMVQNCFEHACHIDAEYVTLGSRLVEKHAAWKAIEGLGDVGSLD